LHLGSKNFLSVTMNFGRMYFKGMPPIKLTQISYSQLGVHVPFAVRKYLAESTSLFCHSVRNTIFLLFMLSVCERERGRDSVCLCVRESERECEAQRERE
jgi:hypothetical protein